ncbi:dnaJ homolog subfamily C member 17 isoform X2 [Mobula hypostoma]|uniref:dnaJ homolog subfamily C member 17 isoform X2 n=1 Tax=Mobula hypostoma TaxID=723540 RepID=UPI002FC2ECE2
MAAKEILQLDLYSLLGVGEDATDKEIKKAYRQKALKCHPDKNPDNPKAAELFHQLSQALEVLTTAAAKAAYDQIRKAKKRAAERNQKLDSKRKKVKLDLEAREREAQLNEDEEVKITKNLDEVIAKLREEGSRNLLKQQRLIEEQIILEREQRLRGFAVQTDSKNKPTPKLKLRWKCNKDDESNGGYSHEFLLSILRKELALKNETGLISNPLKISWLEGQPPVNTKNNTPNVSSASVETGTHSLLQNTARTERDYESLVMMRMRQAAERQRLIEELQKDDD